MSLPLCCTPVDSHNQQQALLLVHSTLCHFLFCFFVCYSEGTKSGFWRCVHVVCIVVCRQCRQCGQCSSNWPRRMSSWTIKPHSWTIKPHSWVRQWHSWVGRSVSCSCRKTRSDPWWVRCSSWELTTTTETLPQDPMVGGSCPSLLLWSHVGGRGGVFCTQMVRDSRHC